MKRIALVLFLAITGSTAPAGAAVRLSFEFFHNSLEPYGEWADAGDYGYVWHPNDVDDEWAPYTDGYWAYTDAGWTWVSYEDWGGITYHYGRWVRVGGLGWCWIPGYEWGPAWVSWRRSDDYIGWAPLPPEARWHRNTGFSIWVDTEYDIGPGYFRFCRVHDFGAPVLRHVLLPRERNVTFIEQTINITNITYRKDRGHVFNGGPDYNWVSPRAARSVPTLKLVQNTTDIFTRGSRGNVLVNAQRGNTLVMAAPAVAPNAATAIPKLASAPRSIPAPQIDRGWAGLAQDPARERIATKFKQDAQGQTSKTSPAAAFSPAAVAAIPKRADTRARLPLQPSAPAAPMPPDTVANPVTPKISKPAAPPADVSDSRGKSAGRKSGRFGAVPQAVTPPGSPAESGPPPAVKTQPLAPIAEPRTGKLKNEPGTVSGRERTIRSGKSIDQDAAARGLDQQRAAEAARQKQAALEAKRSHDALLERQRQQAVEAPRRQPVTPRTIPPEVVRRPVEVPRPVERSAVARPGTPTPKDFGKGKRKGEDEKNQ